MTKFISGFFSDTSGAVTVDWVVLTAAVVGLGIGITMSIADGTTQMGEDIGTFMETDPRFIQNQ